MKRFYDVFVLFWTVSLFFYGCDKAADMLSTSKEGGQANGEVEAQASYEKDNLMSLLDDQEYLATQIKEAKDSGDMNQAKELFDEFEANDAVFMEEFDAVRKNLSSGSANEISRRRNKVIRSIN